MPDTIMEGGLHITFEMRLDAAQIAKMPPQLVRVLLGGVAQIVGVQQIVSPAEEGTPNGG